MAENKILSTDLDFEKDIKNNNFKSPNSDITKTGTTIVGMIFKDGVILGTDTRTTITNYEMNKNTSVIKNKNTSKIYYLSSNIYCCGTGICADLKKTIEEISSEIEQLRLQIKKPVQVKYAKSLLMRFIYINRKTLDVGLIVGGVDDSGASIYSICSPGCCFKTPFATLGTGAIAAMAVFETEWKPMMELEEGKKLVRNSVAAGILNDLDSGGSVDLSVITKNGAQHFRPYEAIGKKRKLSGVYRFKRGSTAVLSTKVISLKKDTDKNL